MKMANKGFSLVELMVVVGVIAMLAAVAVPQFSKFQARARTAEAKSKLASLFSSEHAFFVEWGGYAASFQSIGFLPSGDLYYNIGFTYSGLPFCPNSYVVAKLPPPPAPISAATDCVTAGDSLVQMTYNKPVAEGGNAAGACNYNSLATVAGYNCRILPGADGNPPPEGLPNVLNIFPPLGTSFRAAAVATLTDIGVYSVFTIDQSKTLVEVTSGY